MVSTSLLPVELRVAVRWGVVWFEVLFAQTFQVVVGPSDYHMERDVVAGRWTGYFVVVRLGIGG